MNDYQDKVHTDRAVADMQAYDSHELDALAKVAANLTAEYKRQISELVHKAAHICPHMDEFDELGSISDLLSDLEGETYGVWPQHAERMRRG